MNLLQWIKNHGYSYTWNFKLGTATPDVIAFRFSDVIAFVLKRGINEIDAAKRQCIYCLQKANRTYIALPREEVRKLNTRTLSLFKRYGIGLIEVNRGIKVKLEAKFFPRDNKQLIEELNKKSLVGISFPQKDRESIKQKLIDVLKEHPEGIPILEIARVVGLHRHTITKYVYELINANIIRVREIGTAKLCFLKETFPMRIPSYKVVRKSKRGLKE